jgi:translation initiation factor 2 beta subunit (eIF-2beta)/eIF-5
MEEYLNITDFVSRAYEQLEMLNKNKKKPTFPQPNIISKDRKTFFINFSDLCEAINRTPEYVKKYLETETNISTSILADGGLKFDISIKPQQIKNIVTTFIKELIICKDCKSCITQLEKDSRLTFMCCYNCNSKKSI